MGGALTALLFIGLRFRIVRYAVLILYAAFASFVVVAQVAVGSWWSESEFFGGALILLGVLLLPVAILLGAAAPAASWRWGLWLTWPTLLLSLWVLPAGFVGAAVGVPLVMGSAACGASWLGATVRTSMAFLFSRPTTDRDRAIQESVNAASSPMTAEELAAESSWEHRGVAGGRGGARPRKSRRRSRR